MKKLTETTLGEIHDLLNSDTEYFAGCQECGFYVRLIQTNLNAIAENPECSVDGGEWAISDKRENFKEQPTEGDSDT